MLSLVSADLPVWPRRAPVPLPACTLSIIRVGWWRGKGKESSGNEKEKENSVKENEMGGTEEIVAENEKDWVLVVSAA